jgi:glycosyltransferase involved in cell wall biosynthesis
MIRDLYNLPLPHICVVIPLYKARDHIANVLSGIPEFVRTIVVVDDCSPDDSYECARAAGDLRVYFIRHQYNQGVGGAMISGFQKALELGAQIIVKMDGDGQMDTSYLLALIYPLILGNADYAKGNRFNNFQKLNQMSVIYRLGNIGFSFLAKVATGYWGCFDPTNGYFAIRAEVLAELPLERIDRTYFFEISMLSHLYLMDAYICNVPIPANYQGEISNLSIRQVLLEFPIKLLKTFFRRIVLKYYLYDFSMVSIYLLIGLPLLFFGLTFGAYKWIQYFERGIPAPTGTVVLPTISVIVGIQILLSAVENDLRSTPKKPLSNPL